MTRHVSLSGDWLHTLPLCHKLFRHLGCIYCDRAVSCQESLKNNSRLLNMCIYMSVHTDTCIHTDIVIVAFHFCSSSSACHLEDVLLAGQLIGPVKLCASQIHAALRATVSWFLFGKKKTKKNFLLCICYAYVFIVSCSQRRRDVS